MNAQPGQWREVTRAEPCAICGRPDWCCVAADGARICRRLDTGAGQRRLDRNGAEFWFYGTNGRAPTNLLPCLPHTCTAPLADVTTRDRVYRAALDLLKLESHHLDDLCRRGLTVAEIDRRGYRSLPLRGRSRLAAELARWFSPEVCARVPGWYVREGEGRRWPSWAGAAGLLIPVRNHAGRIVALSVRGDVEAGAPRYSWVSSASHGGPSADSPCHVSLSDGDTATVRLTEGALKSDVATALSRVLTVGLSGVSVLGPGLLALRELGARTVLLAFDADCRRNPHVAHALRRTWEHLRSAEFGVAVEVWDDADGKGIDDALAAGSTPQILWGIDAGTWLAALSRWARCLPMPERAPETRRLSPPTRPAEARRLSAPPRPIETRRLSDPERPRCVRLTALERAR